MGLSDFSGSYIAAVLPKDSQREPGESLRLAVPEISRFPCEKLPHMHRFSDRAGATHAFPLPLQGRPPGG